MPFNQEALKTMHKLAEKEGYSGDESQLQELLSTNKDALDVMFKLARREGYNQDVSMFSDLLGVKKKGESDLSLDISAGPYAGGQKPKGFGDIVSEKISEVSPQEEAKKASITDFGKKLESFAVKHPEMAVAGSMEGLSEKKKAEELDTYGGSVKRVAAESFSKLLKAPAGGLAIIKSIVGDDKEVNDVEKFIQEIANVGHKVSDEIKKEDELISNYKETSITKLLRSGKFAEAGSRLGKGIAGSIAALPMYMNPATISATIASAASDTEHEAKLEGRAVKGSDVAADVAIASLEIITEKAFGTGSIIGKTFSKLNKSGADAALDSFRKSFQKDLAKTYGWELGGELSNTLGAYVINKARGKDQPPLSQQLSDTALQTLAMTSGFHVIGKLAEKKEKEQTKEGTPTISEEQQAQLSLSKPNRPELPPDAGGGGMPQAQSELQNQPLTQEENAVQIESTSSEVSPTGETGQVIPQGSEGVRQGEQGAETTQQGSQEEIGIISNAVNELQQNNVPLTVNDIPVSIEVTNEGIIATDLETGDSVLVNSDDVLVDGQHPLTDVINEHLSQPEQQQAPPTELPKKIFHATKASFEGLPSRQEQGKVSSYGTEPAGTFYSTNPDQAKQAIGDGGDARVIEADFNPKNPLVIENTDNEVYSNIKNESEQQAVEEFFDEYAESGVDLTTLEEGEIPEKVKKRTTEIFADKLKEQGYDAVVNNDNGDIIVLDDTIVTEKKDESVDSKDEVEYESHYDNLELSDRGKELQKQIDSIDDIITNKDKPLSNIQKFRLKDISPLLLKGDIYALVNLALLNIKTPVLLRDGVLNDGTQVKGIGVNKKDTWIATSTDANKAMSMDDLIHRVTEFVTQHIGEISQTDESGNASVAELINDADIPNMVYDIITGSKESSYEVLKQFADQEIDINSLMEQRDSLQKELDEDIIQHELLVSQESSKIDLREIQKNFELLFEVGGASKKKNLTSDPKVMEIYNNFDNIIEQLGYKKTKDADC